MRLTCSPKIWSAPVIPEPASHSTTGPVVALQSISFIVTAAIMRCFMIAYCLVSSGVNLDRADATPAASQTRINRPALMIKPERNQTRGGQ